MSQIYKRETASSMPPEVATTYTTDSGSATPSGNILDVKAIDVSTFDENGIQTRGGASSQGGATNDLEIQLTNRLQGGQSTTGAATTELIEFDLGGTTRGFNFDIDVVAIGQTSGDVIGAKIKATAKTDGATASIVDTEDVDINRDASLALADIDFTTSGNDIVVSVTGVAAENMTWQAIGTYVRVG